MRHFAAIRTLLLLAILVVVAATTAHQYIYSRLWARPLDVVIYPINADAHLKTDNYINSLKSEHFAIIDQWMAREAERHDLALPNPVRTQLGPAVHSMPPAFPEQGTGFDVLVWGLKMRYWTWKHTPDWDPEPTPGYETDSLTRVRIFVMYHDDSVNTRMPHSVGLQRGLIGLVHAFATPKQTAQNNIVIAHELLHTVGATDKYEAHGSPMFPVGYAYPHRAPLFPQRSAEIMAGRIPLSHTRSYMAESLKSVIVNEFTAMEINWID